MIEEYVLFCITMGFCSGHKLLTKNGFHPGLLTFRKPFPHSTSKGETSICQVCTFEVGQIPIWTWLEGKCTWHLDDVQCIASTKQKLLLHYIFLHHFMMRLHRLQIKSFNRIITTLENRHRSRVFFYFRFRSILAVWHFLSLFGLTLSLS